MRSGETNREGGISWSVMAGRYTRAAKSAAVKIWRGDENCGADCRGS